MHSEMTEERKGRERKSSGGGGARIVKRREKKRTCREPESKEAADEVKRVHMTTG